MNDSDRTRARPIHVGGYMWVLAAAWTAMVAASLMWNVHQQRRETVEVARTQARAAYEKDLVYRHWNAGHGGVYVPVTEETQPNPYLSDVPERDITTPSGKRLTLTNPAYMTRQVHKLGRVQYGVRNHITSLRPIRPENAADPWETGALQAFERGETEVSSVEKMEGKTYMRLMRPLFTEEACLKCHATHGYKVGDVRGGISVSVPMAPLWAIGRKHILTLSLGHAVLWLLGLGGIGAGTRRLRQRVRKRDRVEEAVRAYSERLEEMVDERTKDLRDAQEQLVRREKLAVLGQLAGGVGHELRNPLGVISNAVYYLKMVLPDADEPIKEYLELISSEVRNSEKIISELLDFSRTRPPEREEVAVSKLIAQVLKKQPPPEKVQVIPEIASDLPAVFVDPRQMGQVLGNLVLNAYQAMPEGGELILRARVEEGQVALSVADTGCGISRENLEKLFEPLFTTKVRGIGLGLALSRNLVEANGGSIEVESEVGKGSTFTVLLPTKEGIS